MKIWSESDQKANNLMHLLMGQVRYPYAWRKLQSARLHLIDTHTKEIDELEWCGQIFVRNMDVPPKEAS